ncbi:MAG: polyphosphate kinase 1, partial [Verrucomicrobiota bacterium]
SERPGFAIIPIGRGLPRIVTLPAEGEFAYIFVEDIIKDRLFRLLPDAEAAESVVFRVTRNADLRVHEDDAGDFLSEMETVLSERKRSSCVRLEVEGSVSKTMLSFLKKGLNVRDQSVFKVPRTVDLSALSSMTSTGGFESLKYEEWQPQPVPELDRSRSIFSELSDRNLLMCHPYETFEPVLRFMDEAARDPQVLAIKQTLYRTSSDSPVIASLKRAAENGKYVTVVVELKARFDEARNIEWAKALEEAGVQVIYGVRGLKTHSKVCIVVRKEASGVVRYIHFGTGNYNEKTARLYSDISYFTSGEDFGRDASAFFNAVTGYTEPQELLKIAAAPTGLRERLLELIEGERQRSLQGQPGFIKAKINSLVDPGIIEALCKASQAGVEIELNVRGICCLKPGIKGKSENISVVSIIDRYLEHSRIFYFHRNGDSRIFISSADWMPRNLDRRLELMVPVDDSECKKKIVDILETYFKDNVKSWMLRPDGSYCRRQAEPGEPAVRSQEVLYRKAVESARQAEYVGKRFFEPHYAPSRSR